MTPHRPRHGFAAAPPFCNLAVHDMTLDPRTPFDSVPEAFDRWRPRYCDELFDRVASRAALLALELARARGSGR